MKRFSVNINSNCEVVLQARGVAAIRSFYRELRLEPPAVEVGQVYRAHLWQIMQIMGSSCAKGQPPFEPEITLLLPESS